MSNFSKWAGRQRRIIGRVINNKVLPAYTYRWDTRLPATIRATGFQPWNVDGEISMIEHVKGSYADGHAQAGKATKFDSQWVSTGAYGMVKRLDPTLAQRILESYLYKIDTATALATGDFMDANDVFDKAGVDRPYSTQREWVKIGGIDGVAVIEFMDGQTYSNQLKDLNGHLEAPDEQLLTGWHPF